MIRRLLNVVLLVLFGVIFALAQEPKKAEAQDPAMPVENKAAIQEIQIRMLQEQNEYSQLQTMTCTSAPATPSPNQVSIKQVTDRMKELGDKFTMEQAALAKAKSDALKAAHLDEKDWDVDLAAVKFAKRTPPPAPPTPPAKAEEKKP